MRQADEEANKRHPRDNRGQGSTINEMSSGSAQYGELVDGTAKRRHQVIGVGGGGGNAVDTWSASGIDGGWSSCASTPLAGLKHATVKTHWVGLNITTGLGEEARSRGAAGSAGRRDRIVELVEGCDMLFITAAWGWVGNGAAPVVAQVAKELDHDGRGCNQTFRNGRQQASFVADPDCRARQFTATA